MKFLRAVSVRCQLLIGSWEGNPYQCPCSSPKDCRLRGILDEYAQTQRVREAKKRSLEKFQEQDDEV